MPNQTVFLCKDDVEVIDGLCKDGKCRSRYAFIKEAVTEKLKKVKGEEKNERGIREESVRETESNSRTDETPRKDKRRVL